MKFIMCLLFTVPFVAFAGDVIRLDGISIQGNSEEPNVLYITPWQPAPGAGRLFTPVKSYRQQWFKPISRQVMQREVKYLNHFQNKNTFPMIDENTKNK
jgi:hypothetical protein